jgi:hypothetical protein
METETEELNILWELLVAFFGNVSLHHPVGTERIIFEKRLGLSNGVPNQNMNMSINFGIHLNWHGSHRSHFYFVSIFLIGRLDVKILAPQNVGMPFFY